MDDTTVTIKMLTDSGETFDATVNDVPRMRTTTLLNLLVDGTAGRAADGVALLTFPVVPQEFIDAARQELARRIDRTEAAR